MLTYIFKQNLSNHAFALIALLLIGCSGPLGTNTDSTQSGHFSSGDVNQSSGVSTNSQANAATAGNGYYPEGWQGLRQDATVEYGTDNKNLYVSAHVYYGAENAGDDALYTFFLQRIDPAPEKSMREIMKALGKHKSDTRVVENVCRCGQKSTFRFFWEHVSLRRGALHASYYNTDNKLQGDWIVDHNVSDKQWYKGTVAAAKQGLSTLFFGADTENPAAFMGVNSSGFGYLRTWFYHPNSIDIFATTEHRWDSRDDMRLAISCDINMCPSELQSSTEIFVQQHFSHAPSWRLP